MNRLPSTPISSPRRNPRTPQFSLRSSRNSPPRFREDKVDDAASCGSPLLSNVNENDSGFGSDNFAEIDFEIAEPNVERELSLNEKHKAIIDALQKIVLDYWDALQQEPYSHARLSKRCFVVQDLDPKSANLKVSRCI